MNGEIPGLFLAASKTADTTCYMLLIVIVGLFAILYALARLTDNAATIRKTKLKTMNEKAKVLEKQENDLASRRELLEDDTRKALLKIESDKNEAQHDIDLLAKQKSQGFPWLAEAYSEYAYLRQLREADQLAHKRHPAWGTAERVRDIARDRRVVEQKLRVIQWTCEYWLDLFPFLEDWLGDDVDEELLRRLLSKNIEVPFKDLPELDEDPVRLILNRLPDDEYRRLSSAERNQRALDSWLARTRSKWQIGRDYERYIGWLYEERGFSVYYQGILEGYEDLGRDLIAKKGKNTIVVQCKCWSTHKVIREKHVNQLFGTMVKYRIENPAESVEAMLSTSTVLSEKAKEFARHLGVQFQENFPIAEYPRIKCNVSHKSGERIYHLPFDQMYDRTTIDAKRGECYVATVQEAEQGGFRRAWKWRGNERGV
jgi:hypothetical protein